jgi:hypothetical protein
MLAGALLCGLTAGAFAQPAPPSHAPTQQAAPAQGAPDQSASQEQEDGTPHIEAFHRPLLAASSLEVTKSGGMTRIQVLGVASSDGWEQAVLVPLVHDVPSDGVLDLVLVAEPPSEAMPATGFTHLEATILIEGNHPYKAVRVRTATNVISLRGMSGKAEAPVTVSDCHDCIGRPIAKNGSDGVKLESLPKGSRILSPADPFEDVTPNPNRLTLLVGDDGKIIEAMWQ